MKRKSNKIGHRLFRAAVLAGGILSTTACSETEIAVNDPEQANRTVIVYMSARNSLYANATADSIEMVRGAATLKTGDQMLVYICRKQQVRLYRVTRQSATRGMDLVMQYSPDVNASDPGHFGKVLRWIGEHYPSTSYGLVLWSHSDGWLPATNTIDTRGFGIDAGADAPTASNWGSDGQMGYQMDLTDLAEALQESGIRPEFIFFDSCLMQCVEAAYTLRDATDYILASPAQIPAVGAQYDQMMEHAFYQEPFDPATLVEEYVREAATGKEYGNMGVVLSAIKTDELEALAEKTKEMLTRYAGPEEPDLSGVLAYDVYSSRSFYRPEYYDLQETMRRLITDETDFGEWQDALNRCVVACGATPTVSYWVGKTITLNEGAFCGVSTFVPQTRYTTYASRCLYGDLNQAFTETEWYTAAGWDQTGIVETVTQTTAQQ